MNLIEYIKEYIAFKSYNNFHGCGGTITQWADKQEYTPPLFKDWITRKNIIAMLKHNGYEVKQFPNPRRLKAFKGGEEFILDTPDTSSKPTPWGLSADEAYVSILPVQWVAAGSAPFYEVMDIPNRSSMVGIRRAGVLYPEIKALLQKYGKIIC